LPCSLYHLTVGFVIGQELDQKFVETLNIVGAILVIQLVQFHLFHELLMASLQKKVEFLVPNFATRA
jgi:putative Mn2+ efflux pump MntP